MNKYCDIIIIGGGIYGSYAASFLAKKGIKTLIIECDNDIMSRASMVNQARLHNGLHYPRAKKTLESILKYRERFIADFGFSINKEFEAFYAISSMNSLTSPEEYSELMKKYEIKAENVDPLLLFRKGKVDVLYKTSEYSFDYNLIKEFFYHLFTELNINVLLSTTIHSVDISEEYFDLRLNNGEKIKCKGVINATYGSINSVDKLFNIHTHNIMYELCELSLCKVPFNLNNKGITVMDGPFFSIMPFGFSGFHSISSVNYTPHFCSTNDEFPCMKYKSECNVSAFSNCNVCKYHPETAFLKMKEIYIDYMHPSYRDLIHIKSLYSIKPILNESFKTDDRPNEIFFYNDFPLYLSALAGKFFTFYEMDTYLNCIIEKLANTDS